MTKMVLFDIDGVILSEERYFDASALTVWELIHSPNYLGIDAGVFTPSPEEKTVRKVRKDIFEDDHILHFIKERGINANWDMVYLTFSYQLISVLEQLKDKHSNFVKTFLNKEINHSSLQEIKKIADQLAFKPLYPSFVDNFKKTNVKKQELLNYLNTIAEEKTGVATTAFSRRSALWDVCQEAFQEWYLGDEKVQLSTGKSPIQTGKRGFLTDEIPIVRPSVIADMLQKLKNKGLTLGVGTGRPEIETIEPLKALKLHDYFEVDRIVTASDVLHAERKYPEKAPLAKPQPYSYIYGWLGKQHPEQEAIKYSLPLENGDDVLVVGDSVADYYAAKTIGCKFAAVLTGLSGQDARSQFEELNADYILNDVTEVIDII